LGALLADWHPDRSPLRMVAHTAGSVKALVTPEILKRGLIVLSANTALAEAVAEFTFASFFAMRRQILQAALILKTRREVHRPYPAMHELNGSTIGIIGASAVGQRVIHLLQPWDVTILLYDPYCSPVQALGMGAHELVELDDLLKRSDIISLHAPVTPTTLGMLGKREFALMKNGALFVNTARGKLIDHSALLSELQSGRLEALLDVTDPEEPLPADSPFYQLDNCVILPHIAGHSWETRERQAAYCIEDILRFLKKQPLQHAVDWQRWDQIA
jgi:phosphoglycerate dehydrogenase-like enzyme